MCNIRYVCLTVGNEERLKNIEIMKKQIPELEVFVDSKREKFDFLLKVWDNIKNDDVVWLEDDVLLCNNFKKKIENEIRFLGNNELISFFYVPIESKFNLDSKQFKNDSRTSYRDGKYFLWNQCVFIPKYFSSYFINYYNNRFKKFSFINLNKFNYDNCIAFALGEMKQKYWLIRPSLVQHFDKKSTLEHSDNRVALFTNLPIAPYEKNVHFEYINVKLLIARWKFNSKKKDHNKIDEIEREIKKYKYLDFNNIDIQVLYAYLNLNIEYIYIRCTSKNELIAISNL